jgi:hypothetical protein
MDVGVARSLSRRSMLRRLAGGASLALLTACGTQAIHYAIDRERYVNTVLRKRGEARSLPWTSASPAYDANKNQRFAFDLDKAKSLIAQHRRHAEPAQHRVRDALGHDDQSEIHDRV